MEKQQVNTNLNADLLFICQHAKIICRAFTWLQLKCCAKARFTNDCDTKYSAETCSQLYDVPEKVKHAEYTPQYTHRHTHLQANTQGRVMLRRFIGPTAFCFFYRSCYSRHGLPFHQYATVFLPANCSLDQMHCTNTQPFQVREIKCKCCKMFEKV